VAELPKGSIAICQNPNGEGVWWVLKGDDDGTTCVMSDPYFPEDPCCRPKVFIPAEPKEGK
jgi:hypothetical protein